VDRIFSYYEIGGTAKIDYWSAKILDGYFRLCEGLIFTEMLEIKANITANRLMIRYQRNEIKISSVKMAMPKLNITHPLSLHFRILG
jgi:hypothetical protein